jgi:membrane protease YdiL (CAAX protease family)
MESGKIEIRIFLLSLLAVLVIETASGITALKTTFLSPLPFTGIVRFFQIILLILILSKFGKGISSIGLDPRHWSMGVIKGIIWSIAFGACAALVFIALIAFRVNPLKIVGSGLPYQGKDLFFFFLIGGFISPVTEEIFFRGIIYGFIRRWGAVIAVISTTVIFAVAHSGVSPFPFTQLIGGLLFAIAYEVEGNLMVPITIHVLGNMAIFVILLMI